VPKFCGQRHLVTISAIYLQHVLMEAGHLKMRRVNKDGAAVGPHVVGRGEAGRVGFGNKMADKASRTQGLGQEGKLVDLDKKIY
jgi:hypothetical protein